MTWKIDKATLKRIIEIHVKYIDSRPGDPDLGEPAEVIADDFEEVFYFDPSVHQNESQFKAEVRALALARVRQLNSKGTPSQDEDVPEIK